MKSAVPPWLLVPASLLVIAGGLSSCATIQELPTRIVARATLATLAGTTAGGAVLAQVGDRLTLTLALKGLPDGIHGAHIHTAGRCDGTAFANAGSHLNPLGRMHGTQNPKGSHMGDMPNIAIGADGNGTATILLIDEPSQVESALFDSDGAAIVIHAGQDDYLTDPSGNSGGRIACGVLVRG